MRSADSPTRPSLKTRIWTAATLLALTIAAASPVVFGAQTSSPSFDVASVKSNKSGDRRVMMRTEPGGRYTATNVTVRDLVREAYHLLPSQLTGEPDWMDRDRFDIVAKADGGVDEPFLNDSLAGPSRFRLMLRALLADRFKLVAHEDTHELPIYALTLARTDRRLGPGLRPASGDLSQLAGGLTGIVQRITVDRTALSRRFDLDLSYTPDLIDAGSAAKIVAVGGDPNGPSIFTALQEQLGLKLESSRGPVTVLVIDGVQHPTED
jgi:hypothetical protein